MDVLSQLSRQSQPVIGCVRLVICIFFWPVVLGMLHYFRDKDTREFNCVPKTSDLTQQLCYDSYSSIMSPLLTPLYFSAITFAVLAFLWVCAILYGFKTVKQIKGEQDIVKKKDLERRLWYTCLSHVVVEVFFVIVMMALFCRYQTLSLPKIYRCNQQNVETHFRTENATCHDHNFRDKSQLNRGIVALMAVYISACVATIVFLLYLLLKRKDLSGQLVDGMDETPPRPSVDERGSLLGFRCGSDNKCARGEGEGRCPCKADGDNCREQCSCVAEKCENREPCNCSGIKRCAQKSGRGLCFCKASVHKCRMYCDCSADKCELSKCDRDKKCDSVNDQGWCSHKAGHKCRKDCKCDVEKCENRGTCEYGSDKKCNSANDPGLCSCKAAGHKCREQCTCYAEKCENREPCKCDRDKKCDSVNDQGLCSCKAAGHKCRKHCECNAEKCENREPCECGRNKKCAHGKGRGKCSCKAAGHNCRTQCSCDAEKCKNRARSSRRETSKQLGYEETDFSIN